MLKVGGELVRDGSDEPKKRRWKWRRVLSGGALAIGLPTVLFVTLGLSTGITAGSNRALPQPDLTVSSNSRYFVDAAGDPFFWMADTAWSMPINLTREEVVSYLDTRAAQGFNVIQTVAIFNQAGGPGPNRYAHWPFGKDLSDLAITDGADPNDANQYDYWDHLDFIISEADKRGMRIALVPIWANKEVGTVLTKDNAVAYGTFLGTRYRDSKVIWVLGGDAPAVGVEDIWRALARGIAIGVTGQEDYTSLMITYHPIGGASSTQWFLGDPWLTFDMIQGGHCLRYSERRDLVAAAYATAPTRPFLDGEPIYSAHPYCWEESRGYSTSIDVRRDAYWAVFAGAAGHTYGDHTVWQFVDDRRPAELGAVGDWRTAMNDEAAWQMRYLVDLMDSHPWWIGIPDWTIVTSRVRIGPERLQAISASDKSYAMVYSPDGEPFDADVAARIGVNTRLSWFNPRTGVSTDLGMVGEGSQSYDPPTPEDWVLVADAMKEAAPSPP